MILLLSAGNPAPASEFEVHAARVLSQTALPALSGVGRTHVLPGGDILAVGTDTDYENVLLRYTSALEKVWEAGDFLAGRKRFRGKMRARFDADDVFISADQISLLAEFPGENDSVAVRAVTLDLSTGDVRSRKTILTVPEDHLREDKKLGVKDYFHFASSPDGSVILVWYYTAEETEKQDIIAALVYDASLREIHARTSIATPKEPYDEQAGKVLVDNAGNIYTINALNGKASVTRYTHKGQAQTLQPAFFGEGSNYSVDRGWGPRNELIPTVGVYTGRTHANLLANNRMILAANYYYEEVHAWGIGTAVLDFKAKEVMSTDFVYIGTEMMREFCRTSIPGAFCDDYSFSAFDNGVFRQLLSNESGTMSVAELQFYTPKVTRHYTMPMNLPMSMSASGNPAILGPVLVLAFDAVGARVWHRWIVRNWSAWRRDIIYSAALAIGFSNRSTLQLCYNIDDDFFFEELRLDDGKHMREGMPVKLATFNGDYYRPLMTQYRDDNVILIAAMEKFSKRRNTIFKGSLYSLQVGN